jgi:pimeloyl-ACP methyl ester carboxylesterase
VADEEIALLNDGLKLDEKAPMFAKQHHGHARCYRRTADSYKQVPMALAALPDSPRAGCLATSPPVTDTLHMDSRGNGDTPALFLHSFAGDSTHWSPALEALAPRRRVVAFDFSGHGLSPAARGRYSVRRLAQDVLTVANAQNLEHFALVGHSLGALVAAEFAAAGPQRVKKLILVDPPPAPGALPAEAVRKIRESLARDPYATVEQFWQQGPFVGARPETERRLLASLRKLARNAAVELTEDSLSYDARPALHQFDGPKYAIVTPENDAPLSLHHAVSDIEYAVVEGTGHWIQLDRPTEFVAVLERLLRR